MLVVRLACGLGGRALSILSVLRCADQEERVNQTIKRIRETITPQRRAEQGRRLDEAKDAVLS
jgi:hypothetical protein